MSSPALFSATGTLTVFAAIPDFPDVKWDKSSYSTTDSPVASWTAQSDQSGNPIAAEIQVSSDPAFASIQQDKTAIGGITFAPLPAGQYYYRCRWSYTPGQLQAQVTVPIGVVKTEGA